MHDPHEWRIAGMPQEQLALDLVCCLQTRPLILTLELKVRHYCIVTFLGISRSVKPTVKMPWPAS